MMRPRISTQDPSHGLPEPVSEQANPNITKPVSPVPRDTNNPEPESEESDVEVQDLLTFEQKVQTLFENAQVTKPKR